MEEKKMLSVEEFLKENGFDGISSDKDKKKILKLMLKKCKEETDWEDFKYSKVSDANKTREVKNEYANTIQNLEIKMTITMGYYYRLVVREKKERKLKRKESFQKVLGIFSKKNKSTGI